jgi:hypothetical protein
MMLIFEYDSQDDFIAPEGSTRKEWTQVNQLFKLQEPKKAASKIKDTYQSTPW